MKSRWFLKLVFPAACATEIQKRQKSLCTSLSSQFSWLTPIHSPSPSVFLDLVFTASLLLLFAFLGLTSPSYWLSLVLSSGSHSLPSTPSLRPWISHLGTLPPAALSLASLLQHLFCYLWSTNINNPGNWMAEYHLIACKLFTLSLHSLSIKVSACCVPYFG